ncbi:MAG: sodium:calcium antiporter [Elusimicrobia bacterium]|nr:sodium:calcium antiporter [Elusimicrobiota bacterium]
MSTHSSTAAKASWVPVWLAAAACLQWLLVHAFTRHLEIPWVPLLPGVAIIGAAFLVTWAAEAAEVELPQSLSIAIVALIAVLPEYAVDIYFAWSAGKNPVYTSYAAANMTGANRLLIGVGWPAVLLAAWWARGTKDIRLSKRNAVELVTLLAATLYSFYLPIKGTLSLVDTAVFLTLFAVYGWLSSRAEVEAPHLEGIALRIAEMQKGPRRMAIGGLMVYAAATIMFAAEPFAEGILTAGRALRIEEFLLVQWLAPLASEAPEFIIAMLFAMKGKAAVGMRALVSSKVNQWTMLIGMLPVAYNLSAGHLHGMPLDTRQAEEFFLTSAQSLFGMVLLMNLEFTWWEAVALLALFSGQLSLQIGLSHAHMHTHARYGFAAGYIALSVVIFIAQGSRRSNLRSLLVEAFRR